MSEPEPLNPRWVPNPDPSSIVVPGVDTTASVNDQIDQIDQLITIRLQNIDANFSRIQHLIATKLLPAFKRYAEGTEPVREAAKFWKSFYETAAQVRIPIASDTSSLYSAEQDTQGHDTTAESHYDPDRTPVDANSQDDDSFVRDAPIFSTPLVRDPTDITLPRDNDDGDSWTASIESPFERLGRQVKALTLDEVKQLPEGPSTSSTPSFSPLHSIHTGVLPGHHVRPQLHHQKPELSVDPIAQIQCSRRKEKSPLRQNVLRHNAALATTSEGTSTPPLPLYTPRRTRGPKNPFLPPNSRSREWNGLVDLRQPSPAKSHRRHTPGPSSSGRGGQSNDYDPDSSDDLFPPGMSPPVTMQFAMPSRARVSPVKLTFTPARRAAEKIGHDLVLRVAERGTSTARGLSSPGKRALGEPSISSIAPSLPSLTKYSGRHIQAHEPPPSPAIQSPPTPEGFLTPAHQIYRTRMGPGALVDTTEAATDRPAGTEQSYAVLDTLRPVDEARVHSPGSDSDSSEHGELNPSAGFLFLAQNNARVQADDSFASSQQSMSSDENEDEAARAARHPLAHIFVGGAEDSFDQDESFAQGEEETVFGARQVGQGDNLRVTMMRDALIDDTYTGAVSLNALAQLEHSPTPYGGEAAELG